MTTQKEVETFLSLYGKVKETIEIIVQLNGQIDNRCYEIRDMETDESGITIRVTYYQYQEDQYDTQYISAENLYDPQYIEDLKGKAVAAKEKRKLEKEEAEKKKLQQRLNEAKMLVESHKHLA